MTTLHIVHGFNVSDQGVGSLNKFGRFVEERTEREEGKGFRVNYFSYGWLGPMGVWFKTGKIASRLRSQVQPGDIGFGHSHGCLIIHEAARLGAPFKKVVYIAPALRADVQFPPQIQQARVYHSKNDSPVKAAKLSRILMPWCFFGHPEWGDMGNVGP